TRAEVIFFAGSTGIATERSRVPPWRSGMNRSKLWLLAAAVVVAWPPVVWSAEKEQRVFAVKVDGKLAGEYQMTIIVGDDGSERLTCNASVRVKHLVGQYRYAYQGTEVWRQGRVQQLDATSDDDGTRHAVHAVADSSGLHIAVDGKSLSTTRPDAWPTTYWR